MIDDKMEFSFDVWVRKHWYYYNNNDRNMIMLKCAYRDGFLESERLQKEDEDDNDN